jgi:hypothetical protein
MKEHAKQKPAEAQPQFAPPEVPEIDNAGLPGELMTESRSGPGGEGIREEADQEKEAAKPRRH